MKKLISLIALLSVVLLSVLSMTGCGSFFASEELVISSINSELLDDGSTKITITYTSDMVEPTEFLIPPGKEGEVGADGNGISSITYQRDDYKKSTSVFISLTDNSSIAFSVPDGLSVIGIEDGIDDVTGQKFITLVYNGVTETGTNKSKPIYIPSGKDGEDGEDGKDGNGIKSYHTEVFEDQSSRLTFELDDGRTVSVDVLAPEKGEKGEDGVGIKQMVSRTESDGYYIDVYYTNDNVEHLSFDRSSQWLSGSAEPGKYTGSNGDYYFNISAKIIYYKLNGNWINIVDFATSEIECTVSFDLNDSNDSEHKASMSGDTAFFINRGESFYSYSYTVPVPTRNGYTFLGWYTVRTSSPDPTLGAFTNLTIVTGDMTLYAAWAPNE